MEVDVNYLLQTIGALHVQVDRLAEDNRRLRLALTPKDEPPAEASEAPSS